MAFEQGVVRRISWRDLFPWLILFRTFRIAISPTLLALATLASIVSYAGWRIADSVFIHREEGQSWIAPRESIPRASNSTLASYAPAAAQEWLPATPTAILEGYFSLAEPFVRLFKLQMTIGQMAYYAFGSLWTLLIWAFVGGVITRRAVVQLGAEEPIGVQSAASFAGRRYLWYLLAPLYPLVGILLLAIPIALVGLPLRFDAWEQTMWIHDLGAILAGLVWIFVVIAGLGAMWLFGGLIFGWPLMWPAISAEKDGDSFEAFSRSFSYVYGKPLHYFYYVVVAAFFGALGMAVVVGAATLVVEFGFWALALGGGGDAAERLHAQVFSPRDLPDDQAWFEFGAMLVGWVVHLVQQVAFAFNFTYFWCAASAIYLLLRMDVDHQEIDEIYLEDDPSRTPAAASPAGSPAARSESPPVSVPQAVVESDAGLATSDDRPAS